MTDLLWMLRHAICCMLSIVMRMLMSVMSREEKVVRIDEPVEASDLMFCPFLKCDLASLKREKGLLQPV